MIAVTEAPREAGVMPAVAVDAGGPPATPKKAIAIAAGDSHTCALLEDHSIACWGAAAGGTLGDGTSIEASSGRPSPKRVPGVVADAIVANGRTTCALGETDVKCWGEALQFLVDGRPSIGGTEKPRVFPGLASSKEVALGPAGGCAVDKNGGLTCWGTPPVGALDPSKRTSTPAIPGGATSVAVAGLHACAIAKGGKAFCWGTGSAGELGVGDTSPRSTPTAVVALGAAKQIATHAETSCALVAESLFCWGGFRCPPTADCGLPDVAVTRPRKIEGTGPLEAFSLRQPMLGLRRDGTVVALENPRFLHEGKLHASPVVGVPKASAITSGGGHACVLSTEGRVFCWGRNNNGQVGDPALRAKHDAITEVKLVDL